MSGISKDIWHRTDPVSGPGPQATDLFRQGPARYVACEGGVGLGKRNGNLIIALVAEALASSDRQAKGET